VSREQHLRVDARISTPAGNLTSGRQHDLLIMVQRALAHGLHTLSDTRKRGREAIESLRHALKREADMLGGECAQVHGLDHKAIGADHSEQTRSHRQLGSAVAGVGDEGARVDLLARARIVKKNAAIIALELDQVLLVGSGTLAAIGLCLLGIDHTPAQGVHLVDEVLSRDHNIAITHPLVRSAGERGGGAGCDVVFSEEGNHACIIGARDKGHKGNDEKVIVVSPCPARVYARAGGAAKMAGVTPCGVRTYSPKDT